MRDTCYPIKCPSSSKDRITEMAQLYSIMAG